MSTANKESNIPEENPTKQPTTLREISPTAQKQYQLQSYTTKSGRVTKIPEKYKD